MPIQRTCPEHDPTSPEIVLSHRMMKQMDEQDKALQLNCITNLVHIACALVVTAAMVFIAVAICSWVAEHHDNYYVFEVPQKIGYGTMKMTER